MTRAAYLDNAATTPVDPRVLETMLPYLGGVRGNPSSLHAPGAAAREAIEEARESVAALLGASPKEIVFTGGGTESDSLAVLGLARAASPEKRHVVISRVEHAAVREAARRLESEGFEVTRVGVDSEGLVEPAEFAGALRPETALAAVVWANNEVGTVEPVEELAGICAERGVPFHADAVQAAGRRTVDVREVRVSTLAVSAHKLYGPQGVGALYLREGVPLEPLLFGGGQERGLRSGTENVAGIVGLGEAARLAREELEERVRHETQLRDGILAGVTEIPGVRVNGHPEKRLALIPAHREQYRRRLVPGGTGRARRPAPDGVPERVQRQHEPLGLDSIHTHVRVVREAPLPVPVDPNPGDLCHTGEDLVPQPRLVHGPVLQLLARQPRRLPETDDARDVLGAAPQPPLLAPADEYGFERHPFPRVEGAHTLRAVEFVRRERERRDANLPRVQR